MRHLVILISAFTLLQFSALALAQPGHHGDHAGMMGHGGGHPGMMGPGGKHHGKSHGGRHGGHNKHYGPKNAAMKILHMKDYLNLTAKQVSKLKTMRDSFIDKYAANKKHLKAARMDLRQMIHDDSVGMKAIEPQLKKIGDLEGKLWRGYIKQVKAIQALLTAEQKALLRHKKYGRPR